RSRSPGTRRRLNAIPRPGAQRTRALRKRISFTNKPAPSSAPSNRETAMRILAALDRLSLTGEGDVKALGPPLRGNRLRVGDWRVLYEPITTENTLEVQRIKNRSEAYR